MTLVWILVSFTPVSNGSHEDLDRLWTLHILKKCYFTDSIEQLGLTPLTDLLDDLIHKNSNVSLGKLVARIKKVTGQSYLFDLSLSSDYRDPRLNAIFVSNGPTFSTSFTGPSIIWTVSFCNSSTSQSCPLTEAPSETTVPLVIHTGNWSTTHFRS